MAELNATKARPMPTCDQSRSTPGYGVVGGDGSIQKGIICLCIFVVRKLWKRKRKKKGAREDGMRWKVAAEGIFVFEWSLGCQ